MKFQVGDYEIGDRFQLPAERLVRPKRKTVAQILRAAYRKHVRDAYTRRAVKRWLH